MTWTLPLSPSLPLSHPNPPPRLCRHEGSLGRQHVERLSSAHRAPTARARLCACPLLFSLTHAAASLVNPPGATPCAPPRVASAWQWPALSCRGRPTRLASGTTRRCIDRSQVHSLPWTGWAARFLARPGPRRRWPTAQAADSSTLTPRRDSRARPCLISPSDAMLPQCHPSVASGACDSARLCVVWSALCACARTCACTWA